MNTPSAEESARKVFIVRMWQEGNQMPSWRGQVHHIGSGQAISVGSLEELLDYFQIELEDKPTSPAEEHSGLR